tara:strand:+ start:1834 stop:1959 length:126 start_codon:yes stop_codon:yes gene_type:complete
MTTPELIKFLEEERDKALGKRAREAYKEMLKRIKKEEYGHI